MTEFALLPAWPLLVGAAVFIAALIGWAACASTPSHRPTRNIGVTFCEDCAVPCTEDYPCLCCRERRIDHARRSNA